MGSRRNEADDIIPGQIELEDYLRREYPERTWGGCGKCLCIACLYWWSERCPYGSCWDDHRAKVNPYNTAHPLELPRTAWSDWDKPGEQAHWCRRGENYPMCDECRHYVRYEGQQIKTCLKCNVAIFQDGYIGCGMINTFGCQRCYEEWEEKVK